MKSHLSRARLGGSALPFATPPPAGIQGRFADRFRLEDRSFRPLPRYLNLLPRGGSRVSRRLRFQFNPPARVGHLANIWCLFFVFNIFPPKVPIRFFFHQRFQSNPPPKHGWVTTQISGAGPSLYISIYFLCVSKFRDRTQDLPPLPSQFRVTAWLALLWEAYSLIRRYPLEKSVAEPQVFVIVTRPSLTPFLNFPPSAISFSLPSPVVRLLLSFPPSFSPPRPLAHSFSLPRSLALSAVFCFYTFGTDVQANVLYNLPPGAFRDLHLRFHSSCDSLVFYHTLWRSLIQSGSS